MWSGPGSWSSRNPDGRCPSRSGRAADLRGEGGAGASGGSQRIGVELLRYSVGAFRQGAGLRAALPGKNREENIGRSGRRTRAGRGPRRAPRSQSLRPGGKGDRTPCLRRSGAREGASVVSEAGWIQDSGLSRPPLHLSAGSAGRGVALRCGMKIRHRPAFLGASPEGAWKTSGPTAHGFRPLPRWRRPRRRASWDACSSWLRGEVGILPADDAWRRRRKRPGLRGADSRAAFSFCSSIHLRQRVRARGDTRWGLMLKRLAVDCLCASIAPPGDGFRARK